MGLYVLDHLINLLLILGYVDSTVEVVVNEMLEEKFPRSFGEDGLRNL